MKTEIKKSTVQSTVQEAIANILALESVAPRASSLAVNMQLEVNSCCSCL